MKPSVKIIQSSEHAFYGTPLVTFELDYWRAIHAEVMTHRMLSKNSSSSRAIPASSSFDTVIESKAGPEHWGANQPGMVANGELDEEAKEAAMKIWDEARTSALDFADRLAKCGLHKQVYNRVIETFSPIKVVLTGTDLKNFFWLRDHPAAQPEIQQLAKAMKAEYEKVKPEVMSVHEWHLPFLKKSGWELYETPDGTRYTLEDARKISVSVCAQSSYRKADYSLEKANKIWGMLGLGSKVDPAHASPTEHQAKPMELNQRLGNWEPGVTHLTRQGVLYSGNFKDWVQYRQLIPGHSIPG